MDTPTDTQSPVSRKRSIFATLKGLCFTLLILTALWFAMRYVLAPVVMGKETIESPMENAPLENRLQALEERVSALENAQPATAAEAPDLSALQSRLSALENTSPAEGAATSISSEEITQLKMDLEKLKSEGNTVVRSLILIGQLQDAIRSGRPFTTELAALESSRPDMKETLGPLAEPSLTGIASLAELQRQFAQVIYPAISAEDKDKSLMKNLRSLVKIRKVGEAQEGAGDEAILARAEAKLQQGKVAEAYGETENVSPEAASQLAPWRARAGAYLAAEAALARLRAALAEGSGQ